MNWRGLPGAVRRRIMGARSSSGATVLCDGCMVSYSPALTGGCCPLCAAVVPGAVVMARTRVGRPFGLRFVWIFAGVVFLLLAHAFFGG